MKIKGRDNTVISFNMYAPWEYTKEEEDLNKASQEGLQLVYGGGFHSRFQKDTSRRYIYQLDYNPKIQDPLRYREAFEEQGWEFINSTYNGWHYFRKEYRENMPENESKIYTDDESLNEMQNRWIKLLTVLGMVYVIMCILYLGMGIAGKTSIIFLEGIIFLLFSVSFFLGIRSSKMQRSGRKTKMVISLKLVFAVAIFLIIYIFFRGFFL